MGRQHEPQSEPAGGCDPMGRGSPRPAGRMNAEATPNRADRRAAWPKRRQWLDRIAGENRLTSGAKAWLMLLAKRSDDSGKPVWGNQVKMALHIGRSDRSVRRYRAEAEDLGYVAVYRSKPKRGPSGRWCRRKANSYYLRLPAKGTEHLDAPRRRQRAGYCVVRPQPHHAPKPPHHAPWPSDHSNLPDTNGRSSPLRGASTAAAPPDEPVPLAAPAAETTPRPSFDAGRASLEAAKARARDKRLARLGR